ncbi:hypothetical protein [Actinoplanes subtropicus]|uniref:hypothetical protein n=1 Tax=Actinoplanes subtropicus TaxID=543632 RepID=UPI0004C41034|nr:hypothetical protein [Actinoplanes subtropicus]
MTRLRGTLLAATVPLFLLSACAGNAPAGASDTHATESASVPADANTLVIRVESVGGFVPAEMTVGRIPAVSVYGDGRLITEGPHAMIYPARSLPNIQEQLLTPEFVQDLVRQGREAGVRNGADFGSPNIADAPSTRVTVGDQSVSVVALNEAQPTDPRLTVAQRTARTKLATYVRTVEGLSGAEGVAKPVAYQPTTVAVLARKYVPPQSSEPSTKPQAWPGPALPGDMLNTNIGIGCVAATGADKDKVLAAAKDSTVITPWTSGGSQWAVTFRPLLPDEQGCAALKGAR